MTQQNKRNTKSQNNMSATRFETAERWPSQAPGGIRPGTKVNDEQSRPSGAAEFRRYFRSGVTWRNPQMKSNPNSLHWKDDHHEGHEEHEARRKERTKCWRRRIKVSVQIDTSPDVHAIPFQAGQKLGFANSLDRLVMSTAPFRGRREYPQPKIANQCNSVSESAEQQSNTVRGCFRS